MIALLEFALFSAKAAAPADLGGLPGAPLQNPYSTCSKVLYSVRGELNASNLTLSTRNYSNLKLGWGFEKMASANQPDTRAELAELLKRKSELTVRQLRSRPHVTTGSHFSV